MIVKKDKNLEDKADNQLVAIRDQGDRQLDLIDNINNGRRRSVGFKNEGIARLEREIKDKERRVRRKEREFKETYKKNR